LSAVPAFVAAVMAFRSEFGITVTFPLALVVRLFNLCFREGEILSVLKFGLEALLCVLVAVMLQISANFANDYFDGIKGVDVDRIDSTRLTVNYRPARTVLLLAIAAAVLASIFGVLVCILSGKLFLIIVGIVCVVAVFLYSGGRKPYGSMALGETAVFIFFGPVNVIGTYYLLSGGVSFGAVFLSILEGILIAAVLVVDNVRDIELDRVAGKITLASFFMQSSPNWDYEKIFDLTIKVFLVVNVIVFGLITSTLFF
jgi:1,4-dihydroxy-2-naphthoate octaprenyltransferase